LIHGFVKPPTRLLAEFRIAAAPFSVIMIVGAFVSVE